MVKIENIRPADIEKKSFSMIESILGERGFDEATKRVVYRVIHTSADFDYADNLYFSPNAIALLADALKNGADIVTDTTMAMAGINKRILAALGGQVHCFIGDADVAEEAAKRGVTRAMVSMEKACSIRKPVIFAIGNAPTALLRIKELAAEGKVTPAGVIGVPVGFVNVVESKEQIITTSLPCIVAKGRKGGSNIAAAIINALLYLKQR